MVRGGDSTPRRQILVPDGPKIRELRIAKGLTQENFRDATPGGAAYGIGSVDARTVYRVERGRHVQPESMIRIARILGTELDEITLRTGEVCPFKGLSLYQETDAHLFGGRTKATQDIVNLLDAENAVCVIGDSGSGKSSLASAGVIPAFRVRHASKGVKVLYVRPGEKPVAAIVAAMRSADESTVEEANEFDQLAKKAEAIVKDGDAEFLSRWAFSHRASSKRSRTEVLVYLDALETVYRPNVNSDERALFFKALKVASRTTDANHGAKVLATLRADHTGDLISDPSGLFSQPGLYALLPMNRSELEEAILKPAGASRVTFDNGIVSALSDEAHRNPDSLPHLSTCLEELWDRRDRIKQHIDLAAFEEVGGIAGSIDRHAEDVCEHLISSESKKHLEGALCSLAEFSRAGRAFGVRRNLAELPPTEVMALEELADENVRLVALGGSGKSRFARITHEVLFNEWQRLREWLKANRRYRNWEAFLEVEMSAHRFARRRGALLTGWRLGQARVMRRRHSGRLTPAQHKFIRKSEWAEVRRRVLGGAALISLLALAVVIGAVWTDQQSGWEAERLGEAYQLVRYAERMADSDNVNAGMLFAARALPNPKAPDWPVAEGAVEVAIRLLTAPSFLAPTYESEVLENVEGGTTPIVDFDISSDGQSFLAVTSNTFHVIENGEARKFALPEDYARSQVLVSARAGGVIYRTSRNVVSFFDVRGEEHELIVGFEQEGTTYKFSDAPGDGTLLLLKSTPSLSLYRFTKGNYQSPEILSCDGYYDLSQTQVSTSATGNVLVGPKQWVNPEEIRSLVRLTKDGCQYAEASYPGFDLRGDPDSDLLVEYDLDTMGSPRLTRFSDSNFSCDLGDWSKSLVAVLKSSVFTQEDDQILHMSDECELLGATSAAAPGVPSTTIIDVAFTDAEQVLLSTPSGAWLHCKNAGAGCQPITSLQGKRAGRGGNPPLSADSAWARQARSRAEPYFTAMYTEYALFFRREDFRQVGVIDLAPSLATNNPIGQVATSGTIGISVNYRRDRYFVYSLEPARPSLTPEQYAAMSPIELSRELLTRLPRGWLELPIDSGCVFGSFPIVGPEAASLDPEMLVPLECGLPSPQFIEYLLEEE